MKRYVSETVRSCMTAAPLSPGRGGVVAGGSPPSWAHCQFCSSGCASLEEDSHEGCSDPHEGCSDSHEGRPDAHGRQEGRSREGPHHDSKARPFARVGTGRRATRRSLAWTRLPRRRGVAGIMFHSSKDQFWMCRAPHLSLCRSQSSILDVSCSSLAPLSVRIPDGRRTRRRRPRRR